MSASLPKKIQRPALVREMFLQGWQMEI